MPSREPVEVLRRMLNNRRLPTAAERALLLNPSEKPAVRTRDPEMKK